MEATYFDRVVSARVRVMKLLVHVGKMQLTVKLSCLPPGVRWRGGWDEPL